MQHVFSVLCWGQRSDHKISVAPSRDHLSCCPGWPQAIDYADCSSVDATTVFKGSFLCTTTNIDSRFQPMPWSTNGHADNGVNPSGEVLSLLLASALLLYAIIGRSYLWFRQRFAYFCALRTYGKFQFDYLCWHKQVARQAFHLWRECVR